MAKLTIESGANGTVRVALTRFAAEDLARLKQIPGHRWNPERKQWSFPDTEETRAALAEIVALPPSPLPKLLAVKPKQSDVSVTRSRRPYVPGRDKPLATNPPHPLTRR